MRTSEMEPGEREAAKQGERHECYVTSSSTSVRATARVAARTGARAGARAVAGAEAGAGAGAARPKRNGAKRSEEI